jgi:hypothetical protein
MIEGERSRGRGGGGWRLAASRDQLVADLKKPIKEQRHITEQAFNKDI